MTDVAIALKSVSKSYEMEQVRGRVDRFPVLADMALQVRREEFMSVLGPSGCGKTTCLRLVAGLSAPDSGEVLVNGAQVRSPGRDRAVVFQAFNLFPWKTVIENAELGLKIRRVEKAERRSRLRDYLELVGLRGFEDYYPHQLSGGMQQRVGIARALAVEPSILLMDEPFGSLDAQTREGLQAELLRILAQMRLTVLFVTHSLDEAVYLSDRIAIMRAHPGRVSQVVDVTLGPGRWKREVRSEPEFGAIRATAEQALKAVRGMKDGRNEGLPPAEGG